MHLHVDGRTFAIGQLGPDFVILRNPADHPPSDAEISFSIDGRLRRWRVQLPEGIVASKGRTPTSRLRSEANGSTVG
jgi:hypothetical protein